MLTGLICCNANTLLIYVEICDWKHINLRGCQHRKMFSYWWTHPSILQPKYIFINSYKEAPYCRVTVLLEYYMLVFLVTLNFHFGFVAVNQLGFEPESPGLLLIFLGSYFTLPLLITYLNLLKILTWFFQNRQIIMNSVNFLNNYLV